MQLPAMIKFIVSTVATISMLSMISCERHSWEDSSEGAKDGTKNLFPKEQHKGDHDDHATHDDHEH